MIEYKHPDYVVPKGYPGAGLTVYQMFDMLDVRVRMIVRWYEFVAWEAVREPIVITRIYEPEGPGITHPTDWEPPFHFVDLRLIPRMNNERVRRSANKLFPYAVMKQTVPPFGHARSTGPHHHLQVTRIRQSVEDWLA